AHSSVVDSLRRCRSKRWTLVSAVAACIVMLDSTRSEGQPNLVRLSVSRGADIRFTHLTTRDGLSPGQIRDVLQDNQGFLWLNTSVFLNRYDGYAFRSYRRDAAHQSYPAGGFFNFVFKDRSGSLWTASTESLDRFDPVTETSTRFPIADTDPRSLVK